MKILIEVDGGLIKYIASSSEVEVVIVDWDNIKAGDEPENLEVGTQDTVTEDFPSIFGRDTELDGRIRARLTELNF